MPNASRGDRTVILITGASSGIGAAIARDAARLGHRLALTARRADRLEEVAGEARLRGAPEVLTISADLADPSTPERLVRDVIGHFGGLDVLVNNAGFGLPDLFEAAGPGEIRRQIEVNYIAPVLLTRWALPHLLERGGMVINVGSAITSLATPAMGVYGSTKAALAYWNDALRRELRHKGLRVCLVEPGPVGTDFFNAVASLKASGDRDAFDAGVGRIDEARLAAVGRADYLDAAALQDQGDELRKASNAFLDPPPRFLTASVETVARRVVRLIERPRRRLSVPKRFVWPWRWLGQYFQLTPWLGDAVLSNLARRADQPASRIEGSRADARPRP